MNDYMLKAWIAADVHVHNIWDAAKRRREEGADFLEWIGGFAVVLLVLGAIATFITGNQDAIGGFIWGKIKSLIGKVTNLGKGSGGAVFLDF